MRSWLSGVPFLSVALLASAEPVAVASLPARPPSAVDAVFETALANADAEAKGREAQERARTAAAADAAARKQRLEAEFEQTLQTANPGQLYALADQLDSDGQSAQARKAYRALVSRFPQHALATTAANRLAAIAQGGAMGGQGARGSGGGDGGGGANEPGGACEAQKRVMDNEFNAINSRRPANATNTQNLQVVMYMTSKALALANGACKGHAAEAELSTGMQAAFDQAKKNCVALSTAPDTYCVPRAPW